MGTHSHPGDAHLSLPQAQQVIYTFLLDIVKIWDPEDVLLEFKHLFIENTESTSDAALPAVHTLLFVNNEREFHNTIKRCCYILINNWEVVRRFDAIQSLIDLFDDPLIHKRTLSSTLKRLRQWVANFIKSPDFAELKLFTARFYEQRSVNSTKPWSSQFASYLLVPQYTDRNNPVEQRQAAHNRAQRLKDKFKFDLAMYTAHAQVGASPTHHVPNPTSLGDEVLRLIRVILLNRGQFSYKNLAHLFLEQVADLRYAGFKTSLVEYLVFSVSEQTVVSHIKLTLTNYLGQLYTEFDDEALNRSLILRTCNRLIDQLLTVDRKQPSYLFTYILSQGNHLTLAIILLKLVLISRSSLTYIEARLADLIRYYEDVPQQDCQWVIQFLEVFRVTFAIFAENTEYSIVRLNQAMERSRTKGGSSSQAGLAAQGEEAFRIFSHIPSDFTLEFNEEITLE